MKIFHLSDLHLGKRVNGFSMLENQEDILVKILAAIDEEQPQAVFIAGDVYDKSLPPAEAVTLFSDFLVKLAARKLQVFIISGNHDSAERLSFASPLIDLSGIHFAPVYTGDVKPFVLTDEYGPLNVYMLPFVKPLHVRTIFGDDTITTYTAALSLAVEKMNVDTSQRNVLIAHQFVTGAATCDSEEISVGGTENVDVSVFDDFDYVALGHIHGPQNVGRDTVRYCGTPLKYSFSEAGHKKSITVAEFGEKSTVDVRTIPLIPRYDMRELTGTYNEITLKENYEGTNTSDYVHITLTDEEDIPGVVDKLRHIYENLMRVDYDNTRTRTSRTIQEIQDIEKKSEIDLFAELFESQNNMPLSDEQRTLVTELFETLKEDAR